MSRKVNSPLISVIVPAYNEEKHVEQCLKSLKIQTYSQIEIIFIDDGSLDKTPIIGKKYADIFIEQEHQGPAVARNKGASIAKGNILVFADADMFFDKKYVEKITEPIRKNKALATFTKEEYIANTDNIWSVCWNRDHNIPTNLRILSDSNKASSARAIRKSILMDLKGFNPLLGYRDDQIFSQNEFLSSVAVKNAICYHYNPDTLKEVYLSARWIGRNPIISHDFSSFRKYFFVNSLINSYRKIKEGAPIIFLVYKIVFDLGIISGVVVNNNRKNYAK